MARVTARFKGNCRHASIYLPARLQLLYIPQGEGAISGVCPAGVVPLPTTVELARFLRFTFSPLNGIKSGLLRKPQHGSRSAERVGQRQQHECFTGGSSEFSRCMAAAARRRLLLAAVITLRSDYRLAIGRGERTKMKNTLLFCLTFSFVPMFGRVYTGVGSWLSARQHRNALVFFRAFLVTGENKYEIKRGN